jgi:glycosyltransferase involved in cell wall biosynthesis
VAQAVAAGRAPTRVLVWTETHQIGGCDRYLADLLAGIDGERWSVAMSGNPNPEFDAWLAERVPGVLPRITVPVASLPGSPLERLRQRIGVRGVAETTEPAAGGVLEVDEGSPARRAAVAGLRYQHVASNFVRLRRLLRRARPDVLHVNNGGYPGGESCRAVVLAARAEGVPRIVHFVHNMAYPPLWPEAVERRYDARLDAATDAWITAAHRASDALAAARGIPREHIHTVHYGLPEAPGVPAAARAELGFADGALNLAVVAAFEPRKGHATLLEALAILHAGGTRVRAAFVGSGGERTALEAQVAALGLGEVVRFLGWRTDVDAILEAADALVLPSLANECLPYAILEAMARGLAVVSTDVAGIPEMVADGRTGAVVAPGDAPALAGALTELAADPSRAAAMGAAGRERLAADFGLARMVDVTTALWRGRGSNAGGEGR